MSRHAAEAILPAPPAAAVPEWPGPALGAANTITRVREAAPLRRLDEREMASSGGGGGRQPGLYRLGNLRVAVLGTSAHLGRVARLALGPARGAADLQVELLDDGLRSEIQVGQSRATLIGTRLASDLFRALAALAPIEAGSLTLGLRETRTIAANPCELPRWLEGVFENVGDAGARTVAAHQDSIDRLLARLLESPDPRQRSWLLGFETSELEDILARLLASGSGRVLLPPEAAT